MACCDGRFGRCPLGPRARLAHPSSLRSLPSQHESWRPVRGVYVALLLGTLCYAAIPLLYYLVVYANVARATTFRGTAALFLTLNVIPTIIVTYLSAYDGARAGVCGDVVV